MIKMQAKWGSGILISIVLSAILIGAFVISMIRMGGPMDRGNALQNELLADILPPPAFVVEPFLLTTLIVEKPDETTSALARLAVVHKEFAARRLYWQTAPVPAELQEQVKITIQAADAFWLAVDQQFLPALAARDAQKVRLIQDGTLLPRYQQQNVEVLKLVDLSNQYRARTDTANYRTIAVSLSVMIVLALAVVVALAAAAWFIGRRIVEPLETTASVMHRMAEGEYALEISGVERRDEIGMMCQAAEVFRCAGVAKREAEIEQQQVVSALSIGLSKLAARDLEYEIPTPFPSDYEALRTDFNEAITALAKSLSTVRVGASTVTNSLADLRAAAGDLAQRNERQAANLADTTGTIKTVTSEVKEAADGAAHAKGEIAKAREKATQGSAVVQRAIDAMADIERSSSEIGEIVNVIDGIAFQTNLLALNAGVEAARAGTAGSGFAVVANEVRALAQRSADAAQNIKGLIEGSSHQVGAGVALVRDTGDMLSEIMIQVVSVNDLIADIAGAAERQAGNLQQVNNTMAEMDRVTQQNAAMVEQSTAAINCLADEANRLTELVCTFRTRTAMARGDNVVHPERMRRTASMARYANG